MYVQKTARCRFKKTLLLYLRDALSCILNERNRYNDHPNTKHLKNQIHVNAGLFYVKNLNGKQLLYYSDHLITGLFRKCNTCILFRPNGSAVCQ